MSGEQKTIRPGKLSPLIAYRLPLTEMPFAGHPTLGSARLVLDVDAKGDIFVTGRVVELGRSTTAV